jgi:hypothetical protein
MGDLSAFIPTEHATVEAIYAWHKKNEEHDGREYLGASIIEHECDRYLWYAFRQCIKSEHDGRMLRLFKTGKLQEARMADELRGIGCEVHTIDPNTNEQFEVSAIGGHFRGHMDGVALGIPEAPKTWHVLEFKTFKEELFKKLKTNGVKIEKPLHYAQMMVYMGLSKMDRALYLAVNKNTDELYSERIEYSAGEFKTIMARAERIIKAVQPPDRMATRPDDFRCKYCEAADLCWGRGSVALPLPELTCRTCCHATPEMDGDARWSCAVSGDFTPCDKHLLIPGLLPFCEPVDADMSWIEFKNHDKGDVWRHGGNREKGEWTTVELMKTPIHLVTASVSRAKEIMEGEIDRIEIGDLSLLEQYPPGDMRLKWEGAATDGAGIEAALVALLGTKDIPDPTRSSDDIVTSCYEYDNRYLLVFYKNDNYAAIWAGIE